MSYNFAYILNSII